MSSTSRRASRAVHLCPLHTPCSLSLWCKELQSQATNSVTELRSKEMRTDRPSKQGSHLCPLSVLHSSALSRIDSAHCIELFQEKRERAPRMGAALAALVAVHGRAVDKCGLGWSLL